MIEKKITWERLKETALSEEYHDKSNQIVTPFDLFSNRFYSAGKTTKFYIGNTNFDINERIAKIIDITEGVETFNIFTRYKFRISPGKNFKIKDVIRNIEVNLGCGEAALDEPTYLTIKALKLKLDKINIPYMIYVLPNGKFEYTQCKNKEEFAIATSGYEYCRENIGGFILSSGV